MLFLNYHSFQMLISVEMEHVMKFFGWKKIPREWQWTFLHIIAHLFDFLDENFMENEQVWLNRIVRTNAKFVCESKTVFLDRFLYIRCTRRECGKVKIEENQM